MKPPGYVVDEPHHTDGRCWENRTFGRFIIERNISSCHRQTQVTTRISQSSYTFAEYIIIFRNIRISEIEIVCHSVGSCTGRGYISGRFTNRPCRSLIWIEVSITGVTICCYGNPFFVSGIRTSPPSSPGATTFTSPTSVSYCSYMGLREDKFQEAKNLGK